MRFNVTFVFLLMGGSLFLILPSQDVYAAVCITPTDYGSIHSWYDASDSSTITKDGADRVSQWDDKAGSKDLVQATGGNQPLWTSAGYNSLDIIDFAGSRWMDNSFTALTLPITVFVVTELPGNTGTDAHIYDSNTVLRGGFYKSSITDRWIMYPGTSSIAIVDAGHAGNWEYTTQIWNGASSDMRFNGASIGTGTATVLSLDGLTVASRGTAGSYGDNKVAEIIIYDALLTGTEIGNVEDYLSAKWGFGTPCELPTGLNPDAVDDLSSPSDSYGTVDLLWTQPNLQTGNLTGYQINYTTPWSSSVNTIITNNTGSSDVSTSITGLSTGTDYSFRVGVWTEGFNGTGNVLNVTTDGNFPLGEIVFNQTNTAVLPITFEEQSFNSTAKFLNVTFVNTYNLSCDFHYKFANTNQTYSGLTSYPVSSTLDETSFIFNDFENEIIDVNCWDVTTGEDADYILTQDNFPLLQQIAGFRNGEYGTDGKIGVYDFVTLAVVILSMIGLNRVNESVGAVFNIILLGGLAFFEIIELPTVIFGLIALVMVFVITSTRKT